MKNLFFYVSIALLSSITMFESHSMDKNQEAVLASKAKVMKTLETCVEGQACFDAESDKSPGMLYERYIVELAENYIEDLHNRIKDAMDERTVSGLGSSAEAGASSANNEYDTRYAAILQLQEDFNKDELRIAAEFTHKSIEGLGYNLTIDSRRKELVEFYKEAYKTVARQ